LDFSAAIGSNRGWERKGSLDYGIDFRQDIGYDVHLLDTLDEQHAFVGAPFPVREVPVDGLVQIA
jgi:hypothetical protein